MRIHSRTTARRVKRRAGGARFCCRPPELLAAVWIRRPKHPSGFSIRRQQRLRPKPAVEGAAVGRSRRFATRRGAESEILAATATPVTAPVARTTTSSPPPTASTASKSAPQSAPRPAMPSTARHDSATRSRTGSPRLKAADADPLPRASGSTPPSSGPRAALPAPSPKAAFLRTSPPCSALRPDALHQNRRPSRGPNSRWPAVSRDRARAPAASAARVSLIRHGCGACAGPAGRAPLHRAGGGRS